jgi:RNA polymerase sigma-70 factor, ECF subfamily
LGQPGNVTVLLQRFASGDKQAEADLFPLVYHELRRVAARYLRRERIGHTLEATALVHEAYLRLVDQKRTEWQDRSHFFAVSARIMRQILVDHARGKLADKRGGYRQKITLDNVVIVGWQKPAELIALDEALTRLESCDPRQSRIVEMRFFAGLTEEEIAGILGVSTRTVKRDWNVARAWLYGEMTR